MALVYDHLLGKGMSRTVDFAAYLRALCTNLAQFESERPGAITIACDVETVLVDLDTVTAIGLVVAELVANSYEHAFPSGEGAIRIGLRPHAAADTFLGPLTRGEPIAVPGAAGPAGAARGNLRDLLWLPPHLYPAGAAADR